MCVVTINETCAAMEGYLPSYSMISIFSFLDNPRDICQCALVCKFWHTLSNDNNLWKELCYRFLPELAKQIPFLEYEAMIKATKDKTLLNLLPSFSRDNKYKRANLKRRKTNFGPKRCLSAYMYFCQEHRAKVAAEHPEISFGGMGKELGDRWKKLPACEKQKYQEKAAEDKQRYANEKADYPARCKREEEAFYVQVGTNPYVLLSLTQKLSPLPKNTNKRKRDQQLMETLAQITQNKNFKVFFQNQIKALLSLETQVKQQQQDRFMEGLAFLFEINTKRQRMMQMQMLMDFESNSDSDSDHYYDSSSDDVGCFYRGGPFFWSSDSDDEI